MSVAIPPRVSLGYPWEKIGDHYSCLLRLEGFEYDEGERGYHAGVTVHPQPNGHWRIYQGGSGVGTQPTLDVAIEYAEACLRQELHRMRIRLLDQLQNVDRLCEIIGVEPIGPAVE